MKQTKLDDTDRQDLLGFLRVYGLGLIIVTLFCLILFGVKTYRKQVATKVPYVVVHLLDDVFAEKDLEAILPQYILTSSEPNMELGDAGLPRDVLAFEYIFELGAQDYSGYEVNAQSKYCVEITPLIDGKPYYPKIFFAYELNEDGTMITDYTLAKEQPFSRLNEEYSDKWRN